MNRTGICPKCGSGEIIRFDGEATSEGTGVLLRTSTFSGVALNPYVCTTCGYAELWADTVDIPRLVNSKLARRKKY
ncbi:MAG: hypothetical protein MJ095_06635 [Oscillospiraceae bacterium]|nr:hypothetical protein [Oscillospiraceae bacterium]